jgi:hypothetical protein
MGVCSFAPSRAHGCRTPVTADRRALLASYLREESGRAFVWGQSDCATFGMDWAQRLTGKRPANARPLPTSLKAFLRRQKTLPLANEVGDYLLAQGFVECRWDDRQPGDIGIGHHDGLPTVMIRTARGWAGRGAAGLLLLPQAEWCDAWTFKDRTRPPGVATA